MALLTAEDVLNKKFQATRMREGYDQDEVDDFLDEVVETFAKYEQENHELKARLAAAERRVAELENEPAQAAPVAEAPAAEQPAAQPEYAAQPQQAEEPAEQPAAQQQGAEPSQQQMSEPETATGMLALAQKLHDDYVQAGNEEHDRIVGEAKREAEQIVGEAKQEQERTRNELEQERSMLERKIDELRVFERDYRTRMRSYLEKLLSEVDSKSTGNSGSINPLGN